MAPSCHKEFLNPVGITQSHPSSWPTTSWKPCPTPAGLHSSQDALSLPADSPLLACAGRVSPHTAVPSPRLSPRIRAHATLTESSSTTTSKTFSLTLVSGVRVKTLSWFLLKRPHEWPWTLNDTWDTRATPQMAPYGCPWSWTRRRLNSESPWLAIGRGVCSDHNPSGHTNPKQEVFPVSQSGLAHPVGPGSTAFL